MKFEVPVVEVSAVVPIEGADAIEAVKVGEYLSVVQKNQFKAGDLALYIPEGAIVPAELLQAMGLEGRLAGKDKNRVKAIKLRGVLSQGLVCDLDTAYRVGASSFGRDIHNTQSFPAMTVGSDFAEWLHITKYEPEVPQQMSGKVEYVGREHIVSYDIENIKKFPTLFTENDYVEFTEKIHGTFIEVGVLRDDRVVVASKGFADKGMAFIDCPENASNVYLSIAKQFNIAEFLRGLRQQRFLTADTNTPIYFFGEVFGKGVQDLHYGSEKKSVRCFDIYIGKPGEGRWLDSGELGFALIGSGIDRVPVLYSGKFSKAVVDQYTNGVETVSRSDKHVREGIVIKPMHEKHIPDFGRLVLKSVSEAYLLRKGGTEFN